MSNHRIVCYLAGDIGPERWRLQVIDDCKDCPIEFLSPVDNIAYSYQSLIPAHKKNRVFHQADRLKVDRADVILAYLTEKSLDAEKGTFYSGTSWELGYAFGNRKHTVVVLDMKPSIACRYELVSRMADNVYEKLDEAVDHLRELSLEMAWKLGEK